MTQLNSTSASPSFTLLSLSFFFNSSPISPSLPCKVAPANLQLHLSWSEIRHCNSDTERKHSTVLKTLFLWLSFFFPYSQSQKLEFTGMRRKRKRELKSRKRLESLSWRNPQYCVNQIDFTINAFLFFVLHNLIFSFFFFFFLLAFKARE